MGMKGAEKEKNETQPARYMNQGKARGWIAGDL